ncbi:MAG: CDGSH iron-sulfur domain-containing protein [Pirellulales bacterium]
MSPKKSVVLPEHEDSSRTPPGVITIRCRENGPFVVEMPEQGSGNPVILRVTDALGQPFAITNKKKRAVALCRCGQSGQRPFCDGTHKSCGFEASETASTT